MSEKPPSPPPNWYPDPSGSRRLRYWDGAQWTDHYSEMTPGAQASPSVDTSPSIYSTAAVEGLEPAERPAMYIVIYVIVVVLFSVVFGAIVLLIALLGAKVSFWSSALAGLFSAIVFFFAILIPWRPLKWLPIGVIACALGSIWFYKFHVVLVVSGAAALVPLLTVFLPRRMRRKLGDSIIDGLSRK